MRRFNIQLVIAVLATTLVGAGLLAQDPQAQPEAPRTRRVSPPQPQQQQGPDYLVGTWSFSWTGRESPVSTGPRAGKVTFARRGASDVLDVRTEGTTDSGVPYRESGAAEWDATHKILTITEKLSSGAELQSVGDWSSPIGIRAESAAVKVGAETVRVRRLYSILSAQSFMVTEEISIDGGPYQRLGNGRFQKEP